MSAGKSRSLTEGPIWRALAAVSAPMSFGIFSVIAVGVADAYFLGQVSGTALAAVGFIYPVITAVTSLSIGLSAGANAVVSQAIGRGESEDQLRRFAMHALMLGGLLSVVIGGLLWLFSEPLFRALGASDAVLGEVMAYMPLWIVSFPFLVLMMITNAVFRAHGNGAMSAGIMILAAFFGIALNPVFIFGWGPIPEMSTAGAALSTLVGRVIAMVAAFAMAWRLGLLGFVQPLLKDLRASTRRILSVGVPASLSNAINPAGMALVTAAVATVGDAAVAGFGAAGRIQSIVLVPLMALSAGIGPVVGQNWGAEKYDRAKRGVGVSFGFAVAYGAVLGPILMFFAEPIAGLVAASDDDLKYAAQYLQIVGLSIFGYGIIVIANAAMNARDKALWSMTLSIGRNAAIYLPGAWLGVMAIGYTGVLFAAVAANIIGAAVAVAFVARNGLLPWSNPLERGGKAALQAN